MWRRFRRSSRLQRRSRRRSKMSSRSSARGVCSKSCNDDKGDPSPPDSGRKFLFFIALATVTRRKVLSARKLIRRVLSCKELKQNPSNSAHGAMVQGAFFLRKKALRGLAFG